MRERSKNVLRLHIYIIDSGCKRFLKVSLFVNRSAFFNKIVTILYQRQVIDINYQKIIAIFALKVMPRTLLQTFWSCVRPPGEYCATSRDSRSRRYGNARKFACCGIINSAWSLVVDLSDVQWLKPISSIYSKYCSKKTCHATSKVPSISSAKSLRVTQSTCQSDMGSYERLQDAN